MEPIHHVPLNELVAEFTALGREEFLRRCTVPFLRIGFDKEEADSSIYRTWSAQPSRDSSKTNEQRLRIVDVGDEYVSTLAKTRRNTFSDRIMLGRAITNDIIVNHPSVSKFHAYFSREGGADGYVLVDVGSSNGTRVGEEIVKPNERVPLTSRETLTFADSIRAVYMEPGDFYTYIDIIRRRAES
jgi:pSer/pThr/pTyr-binding forkhead associated (FHA) protein